MGKKPVLTVGQLIEKLQLLIAGGMSPDREVVTEGCDCYGDCNGVELHDGSGPEKPYVLLTRN